MARCGANIHHHASLALRINLRYPSYHHRRQQRRLRRAILSGNFRPRSPQSTSSGHSSEIPPLVSNGPHVNGITGKFQPDINASTKQEAAERKPSSSPFKIRIPGRSQIAQSAKMASASAASSSVPGKPTTNVVHSSSPTPRRSSRRHASLVASNGEKSLQWQFTSSA